MNRFQLCDWVFVCNKMKSVVIRSGVLKSKVQCVTIDRTSHVVDCTAVPSNTAKPAQQQPKPAKPVTDEDVAIVKDMFPDVEVGVIKSVLEANRGDKDATINNLLTMQAS